MKHAAKKLGSWLKTQRQEQGIVLRVFAGRIFLSPAQYAEVEAGVCRWITKKQESAIAEVLCLSDADKKHLKSLVVAAREAKPLEFSDVYTREQLEPMRARSGVQLTEPNKSALLDAVFKPLA